MTEAVSVRGVMRELLGVRKATGLLGVSAGRG
jgi:hypothetical protein